MVIGINGSQLNIREKSGVEVVAASLISELVRLTQVRGATLRLYARSRPVGHYPHHVEVRILRWPFPLFWTQVRLGWELLIHPPSVFLDCSNFLPFLGLFSRACQFFFAHDASFIQFPERYTFLRRTVMRLGHTLSCWRARNIFVPTRGTAQQIKRYSTMESRKVRIVGLGITQSFIDSLRHSATPHSIPAGKPFVVFVGRVGGRVDKRKNIDQLLIGFHVWNSRHGNTHRLVICGRDDGGKKQISFLAQSIGCNDVEFTGFVSDQELANLYTHSQGVVFPTYGEGIGLPIVEGLIAGKRVLVSTQTGGISDDLVEYLIVCEPHADGIASGIERLLAPDYRPITREVSLIRWKSWENVAKKIYEVLVASEAAHH